MRSRAESTGGCVKLKTVTETSLRSAFVLKHSRIGRCLKSNSGEVELELFIVHRP